MKYVINENRLEQLIRNYFDDNFLGMSMNSDDNLYGEKCFVHFYKPNYETMFHLYNKCYYDDWGLYDKNYPTLRFNNYSDFYALNSYFGNLWKPIFKEWFYENYNFEVKTIITTD